MRSITSIKSTRSIKCTERTKRGFNSHGTLQEGFSLIEMLVVLVVFSILAIVTSQVLIISIRSSKKSESVVVVKQNVDYAMSTMERLLRNAQVITGCTGNQLDYLDGNNRPGRFQCVTTGADPYYIASGSATPVRITSTEVIVDCGAVFDCPLPVPNVAQSVIINLSASHSLLGTGVEGAQVSATSKILLRTF